MIDKLPILARIRIPIPPHLVGPVLMGLAVVLMVFGILLFILLLHMIVTQKKAVFGPNSRIKIKGAELIKELLPTTLMMVVCIVVSIFCFLQSTSGEIDKQPPTGIKDPYATSPPARYIPGMPMRSPARDRD